MAFFLNLEDSPMFRNQIHASEQMADELHDRCQKLQKGCKKFIASIGQAYDGDLSFADLLEEFGAGQDDIVSIAIGGPVMSKFTTAFRELGSYKELLRSQIEHILSERLVQFISVDLKNVKDCRQRYDKATHGLDQALEKYMSLRKGTRAEKVSELEEDLHNSKSAFERCRFNLVSALTNIEAKKKFEFLESVSTVMDAHMRYFKQGYELLSQMEPFIHQILTYTQQSKEMANVEQDRLAKQIQEFRTKAEIANLRSSSNMDTTTSGDGIHIVGVNSYKTIEALMQSTANGEVQIIKQGYLLKRSSKMRDWKRCFFVLDSHGTLYYYRNKGNKHSHGRIAQQFPGSSEGSGVFRRFRSHKRVLSQGDENLWSRTIDLRTSTIKLNAEQTDLRFCFRIISPSKTFTLQAENVVDQMDWVEKVTGVIASLLSSFQKQHSSGDLYMDGRSSINANSIDAFQLQNNTGAKAYENISSILRDIPGNDVCAECGAPEPDWASLNLGIVLCIECSGVHRNLGVHISKVRSLTLDVKVWEPSVIDLFSVLGNAYCNSVWEEMLLRDERIDGSSVDLRSIKKPSSKDSIPEKEKYIQLKYMEKRLIIPETNEPDRPSVVFCIWEAVKNNDVRTVYRLLVASYASPNTRYDEVNSELYHVVDTPQQVNNGSGDRKQFDPATCPKIEDSGEHNSCMQGGSLLHLASHGGNPVMMELLLQFGAEINLQDFHGRTPLHYCVFLKNNSLAKYLIRRGAQKSIKDGGGLTALERAMELGAIADEELFILLSS